MQDEQIRPMQPILDTPTVEDEHCPSTTICTGKCTPFPTTLTPPPSVLWGPAAPQIFDNHSDKLFAQLNHTFMAHYPCSLTTAHSSETREPWNSKDNGKAVGIKEQATKQMEVAEEVTLKPLIMVSARTSSLSMAQWPSPARSPTTLNFPSTYPPAKTFQECQDE